MSLWIAKQEEPNTKLEYHLFFDQYGHLYLHSVETGYQSRIDFDRHNAPSSYLIKTPLLTEEETKMYKMHPTNAKTLEYTSQVKKDKEKMDEEDPEETEPDYYPDDLNYKVENIPKGDEDMRGFFGTEMDDLTDEHYAFSHVPTSKIKIPVHYNSLYETPCLFETIVYDQTDLVMKTNLVQGVVMFRMTVNLADSTFTFRPTGYGENTFYPLIDKDREIVFKRA